MQGKLTIGSRNYDLAKKVLVLGVLNVTPDSFSDGGLFAEPEKAVRHALQMEADGADIIDVGGESTRPGSLPITPEEEIRRVAPVIKGIRRHSDIPVSIDTWKSGVAGAAVAEGADILNDTSGLTRDADMLKVLQDNKLPVIIMHSKGTPAEMQFNPRYDDLMGEITRFLLVQAQTARKAGAPEDGIIIDPGIGFGKTVEHNFTIIRRLSELAALGYPVAIGPSRKSFIGAALKLDANQRLEGTLAAAAAAVVNGAALVRLHDVRAGRRAVDIALRIREAEK